MKSLIELLSVDALALISVPAGSRRQRFQIDETDGSTDPAKIARRAPNASLQRATVTAIDTIADVDIAIAAGEFDDAPRRCEGPDAAVVMHVNAAAICEIAPASESLLSRLT